MLCVVSHVFIVGSVLMEYTRPRYAAIKEELFMQCHQENHSQTFVHKIQSWEELQRLLEAQFCGARWVFRGQRNAFWPPSNKLGTGMCRHGQI